MSREVGSKQFNGNKLKTTFKEKPCQCYSIQLSEHFVGGEYACCVFPFKYGEITYNQCVNSGYTQPWCATEVDSNGNYLKWMHCDENCKIAYPVFGETTTSTTTTTTMTTTTTLKGKICISNFDLEIDF